MTGAILTDPSLTQEETPSVITEADNVLRGLQQILAKIVSRVPGGTRRPTDLQAALGEDYKICWQIFQFIQADNPLAAARHIPSAVSLRKFIGAAASRGIPADLIARAHTAIEAFQSLVNSFGNDRAAFDTMLATASGDDDGGALAIQHRRKAFRSESLLWGVETGLTLSQLYMRYDEIRHCFDVCYVTMKHELRRLRPNVTPMLHGWRAGKRNDLHEENQLGPLEPSSMAEHGSPIVAEFCSQPVPRILSVPAGNGWVYSLLDSTELGLKGSATMTFSGISHNPSGPLLSGETIGLANTQITMPTKQLIVEAFLHRNTLQAHSPILETRLLRPGLDPGDTNLPEVLRKGLQMPVPAEIASLGPAPDMTTLKEIPRHRQLVQYIFQQLGWSPDDFDGFRAQVDYPILHTEIAMRCIKS